MDDLRLLLVEDVQDDADLLLAELALAGLDVAARRVETAAEMRAALAGAAWDLVISDYNLPSFSGEAALAIVREHDPDLPFIVVSGYVGEENAAALMRAGADDFIVKGNYARLAPALERGLREAEVRRENRRAHQRLLASERQLRDITSALGEGILVQDVEGRLLFMNPEAERLLGWREAELLGRDVHDAIHCRHPDGTPYPRRDCPILRLVAHGEPTRRDDEVFVHRDGGTFPVQYVVTPLHEAGRIVAAVTAFQDISERKAAEAHLRESRRQLRALTAFQEGVREQERTRIARELHDELGQALTALRFDLDRLEGRLPGDDPAIVEKVAGMRNLLAKTVDAVRRIAQDLRPGVLDDLGLAAAIEWLADQFGARTGIACVVAMSREEFQVSGDIATAVFRIVQEALTNVARHAEATSARIELHQDLDAIRLAVSDDGKGFDTTRPGGKKSFGLLGIRERVHILGGDTDIVSRPGAGTWISARIPLEWRGDRQ